MPSPFWARHFDRRPFLLGRMRIAAALRQFFAARDFVEVETGTLVRSPGNETHLHAFASDLVSPADRRERLYLRTSPEFACKKLLAAGERRIVEFARSFRNRERGVLRERNTMLNVETLSVHRHRNDGQAGDLERPPRQGKPRILEPGASSLQLQGSRGDADAYGESRRHQHLIGRALQAAGNR